MIDDDFLDADADLTGDRRQESMHLAVEAERLTTSVRKTLSEQP